MTPLEKEYRASLGRLYMRYSVFSAPAPRFRLKDDSTFGSQWRQWTLVEVIGVKRVGTYYMFELRSIGADVEYRRTARAKEFLRKAIPIQNIADLEDKFSEWDSTSD